MPTTAIHASRILTPDEEISDSVILVEGSRISAIGHRDKMQLPAGTIEHAAGGMTVVPGFVDIHIHGAGGHDVMEGTAAALDRITKMVARSGTTSIVATTVTAPVDETCKSLEGPFISKHQRGVHPVDCIQKPSIEMLDKFLAAADGLVRMVTVAPETPGAIELIKHAIAAGLVVGMGHTDSDYDQARAAIQAGARHTVHTYNAMRPFSHRDPGILGAIMTDPEVTAEVIADGVHVAGAAIQVLLGTKGFDTVLLVSDGIAATGMPSGDYQLGKFQVTVKDGVARNAEGKLAGSTLTLDRALRNVVALGVPFVDAVRMATVLPARRLGLAGKKGIIAPEPMRTS